MEEEQQDANLPIFVPEIPKNVEVVTENTKMEPPAENIKAETFQRKIFKDKKPVERYMIIMADSWDAEDELEIVKILGTFNIQMDQTVNLQRDNLMLMQYPDLDAKLNEMADPKVIGDFYLNSAKKITPEIIKGFEKSICKGFNVIVDLGGDLEIIKSLIGKARQKEYIVLFFLPIFDPKKTQTSQKDMFEIVVGLSDRAFLYHNPESKGEPTSQMLWSFQQKIKKVCDEDEAIQNWKDSNFCNMDKLMKHKAKIDAFYGDFIESTCALARKGMIEIESEMK